MKERIILYGGSFNPPHLGHKTLVEYVQKILNPGRIEIIPCYIQPLKNEDISNAVHRFNMAKLMFGTVSDYEIKEQCVSYSIDTVRYFRKENPNARLMFVMGADSFVEIKKWKSYAEIFKEVNIVIVSRGIDCEISSLVCKAGLENLYTKARIIDKNTQIAYGVGLRMIILLSSFDYPVSSTLVRDLVRARNESAIKYLDSKVWKYIIENDLYAEER